MSAAQRIFGLIKAVIYFGVGFVMLVVLLAIFQGRGGSQNIEASGSVAEPAATDVLASNSANGTQARRPSNWIYVTDRDELSGKEIRRAIALSENELEFDFPYQGSQRASLELRDHPRWGRDVILSIERGQFLCRHDNCSIRVRFDAKNAATYSAAEPADSSTEHLFLTNYARFVANLRNASIVRIESSFYQEGARVLTFDVQGLEWKGSREERSFARETQLTKERAKARARCTDGSTDAYVGLQCETRIGDCRRGNPGQTAAELRCLSEL